MIGDKPQKDFYFIKVLKKGKISITETIEKVIVKCNLPFTDYSYGWEDVNVEKFMEDLREWVNKPCFKFFIINNRKDKNKASYWDLPKLRKQVIHFEEVKIDVGEQAKKDIDEEKFKQEIKDILSEQRNATEEEEKAFNKFALLVEKKGNLKRLLPKNNDGYYYSSNKKDETPKITINKEEYNSKLELIKKEFEKLCEEYSILEIPRLDFEEINELMSFKDWRLECEEDYEESWSDDFDDEGKEQYNGNFEEFLGVHYDNYVDNFEK